MINLAGRTDCDAYIQFELEAAEIDVVRLPETSQGEVPANLEGQMGPFTFRRAWYYWVVEGDLPLEIARRLYEADKDKVVRVAGHCGAPAPDNWATAKVGSAQVMTTSEYDEVESDYIRGLLDEAIESGKCVKMPDNHTSDKFVTSYHIDSQEGLALFVKYAEECIINGS